MSIAHLAIDLGASSGRAILGILDGSPLVLKLEEVHRFEHLGCSTPTGPVWDLTGIWKNILTGLGKAVDWCRDQQFELKSIGVDTWGVDWVLLGKSGELLGLPHCYRDPQNDTACQRVLEKLGGFGKLYERTGIQLMSLNTLFQVAARYDCEPRLFDAAERLIFLPDLFHFWLSGEISTELSIASTSSMLSVETGDWDRQLLDQLGLPHDVLGPIVEPGTTVGTLRTEIADEVGASKEVRVIAPAAHDTASAVAAVPALADTSWAYLSSGTWSLLGAELDRPIVSEAALRVPFTNERGLEGTVRFLKNIAGLWLVQELRRDLEKQGQSLTFAEMVDQAEQAESGRTLVDPGFEDFAAPGDMASKLQAFARQSDQPVPESPGQLVRCCLDSLALCYAQTFEQLQTIIGKPVDVLHMVGGGIQNRLLNKLTCEALGRPVVIGPVEGTATGNLLVQAIGCGELAGRAEGREVVRRSFAPEELEPTGDSRISELRNQYEELVA